MTAHVEGAAPPPLNLEARGAVARVLLVAFNVAANILKGVSPAGARGAEWPPYAAGPGHRRLHASPTRSMRSPTLPCPARGSP